MLLCSVAFPSRSQMVTFDPTQMLNILTQISQDAIESAENLMELGRILGMSEENLKAFNDVYGFVKDNAKHVKEAREILSVANECMSRTQYILSVYTSAYEKGQVDLATMNRVLRNTNSTLKFYMRTIDNISSVILQKMSWKEAHDFIQQQLQELLAANFELEDEMDVFLKEIAQEQMTESFNEKMDELMGRGEREGAPELAAVKGQVREPEKETVETAAAKLHGSIATAFRIAEILEAFILAFFAVLAFYKYEKGGGSQHKDVYIKIIIGTLFVAVLTELFKYLVA